MVPDSASGMPVRGIHCWKYLLHASSIIPCSRPRVDAWNWVYETHRCGIAHCNQTLSFLRPVWQRVLYRHSHQFLLLHDSQLGVYDQTHFPWSLPDVNALGMRVAELTCYSEQRLLPVNISLFKLYSKTARVKSMWNTCYWQQQQCQFSWPHTSAITPWVRKTDNTLFWHKISVTFSACMHSSTSTMCGIEVEFCARI